MPKYKCDACGNCVCYSEPKEDWGLPEICLYDVGFPVNWRKVRVVARRSHNSSQNEKRRLAKAKSCPLNKRGTYLICKECPGIKNMEFCVI
jgi:hypothetical protein